MANKAGLRSQTGTSRYTSAPETVRNHITELDAMIGALRFRQNHSKTITLSKAQFASLKRFHKRIDGLSLNKDESLVYQGYTLRPPVAKQRLSFEQFEIPEGM